MTDSETMRRIAKAYEEDVVIPVADGDYSPLTPDLIADSIKDFAAKRKRQ